MTSNSVALAQYKRETQLFIDNLNSVLKGSTHTILHGSPDEIKEMFREIMPLSNELEQETTTEAAELRAQENHLRRFIHSLKSKGLFRHKTLRGHLQHIIHIVKIAIDAFESGKETAEVFKEFQKATNHLKEDMNHAHELFRGFHKELIKYAGFGEKWDLLLRELDRTLQRPISIHNTNLQSVIQANSSLLAQISSEFERERENCNEYLSEMERAFTQKDSQSARRTAEQIISNLQMLDARMHHELLPMLWTYERGVGDRREIVFVQQELIECIIAVHEKILEDS